VNLIFFGTRRDFITVCIYGSRNGMIENQRTRPGQGRVRSSRFWTSQLLRRAGLPRLPDLEKTRTVMVTGSTTEPGLPADTPRRAGSPVRFNWVCGPA